MNAVNYFSATVGEADQKHKLEARFYTQALKGPNHETLNMGVCRLGYSPGIELNNALIKKDNSLIHSRLVEGSNPSGPSILSIRIATLTPRGRSCRQQWFSTPEYF